MSMIVSNEPSSLAGKLWNEIKDIRDRHIKDEREVDEPNPFQHLEKMSVLTEARAFNDGTFVKTHPKRCAQHLVKLLWFATQGDPISGPEAQSVFFGVTKLFTSPDGNLRRLVYLFLRAAAESGTDPSSLIIVTQSLVKDMFNETGLYKGNALRVLGAIVDPSMLSQLERYFRQLTVDRDPYVSSTALTTSLLLMKRGGNQAQDVISRWANEVNTVLLSSSSGSSSGGYKGPQGGSMAAPPGAGGGAMLGQGSGSQSGSTDMVAFHALALLRSIKKHDRLAVSKVVTTLMKGTTGGGGGAPAMRSPLGLCLLIRYAVSLHTADAGVISAQQLGDFLEATMRSCAHKQGAEMAAFEAAKAMVTTLASTSAGRDLTPAVSLLHIFLSSPKGALRFAAVRTLHALAATHPSLVARHCSEDLEALIADGNKAVATLAITTLLKTGADAVSQGTASATGGSSTASVERLIKQIGPFMSEQGMSDELKCTVIAAVHDLALRVPSKHRSLMAFLANALREEGGFDFKKAILDALFDIIESIPESTSEGLLHCCEFIEDCEYSSLASRVLHLLGDKGPTTASPGSFVRYIYNRVILESAPVRASAVTALAKFAARVEDLRPSILPLLARCVDDDDDEVRDRATTYLALFEGATTSHGPKDGQPIPDIATLVAAASAAASAAAAAKLQAQQAAQQDGAAAAAPAVKPGSVIPGVPGFDAQLTRALVGGRLPLPVSALSKALTLYAMRPSQGPFSFEALPHVEVPAHHAQAAAAIAAAAAASSSAGASAEEGGAAPGGAAASAVAPVTGYGYSSEIRAAEAMSAASKVAKARAARAADSAAAVAASAAAAASGAGGAAGASVAAGGSGAAAAAAASESTAEQLYKVKEFASFGPLFRSSRPISLTEAECEYLVSAQKHLFADGRHIVLQFSLRNTVPEIQLERASVAVSVSDPSAYAHVVTIAAPKVREGAPQPAVCYVALARNPDAGAAPSVSLSCELRFASREIDPSTGEALGDPSAESFPLDSLDITPADFVAPTAVADFRGSWESSGPGGEVIEQYALSFKTIADALNALGDTLGMAFCDGSGPAQVKPGATAHAAYLSGTFLGGMKVLARMQLKLSTAASGATSDEVSQQVASGVIVKIGIRSEDKDVSQLLMDCIS